MTLEEIINLARRRLMDYEPPYNWLDSELVDYANNAYNTICRETFQIDDSYTPAICLLTLTADTATSSTFDYSLDSRIIDIRSANITGYTSAITQTGSGLNDLSIRGNYLLDDSDTDYQIYIDAATTTDTFKWSNDGGTTWEATGVSMTGDWQLLDNGIYIKFTATTGHTLDDYFDFTITQVNDYPLSRTYCDSLDNDVESWRKTTPSQPTDFLTDYRDSYITFWPPPDENYLVSMRVHRYPTSQFSSTSMSGQTPEIPSYYHYRLIDGILADAYLRRGPETFDSTKSELFRRYFLKSLKELTKNSINRNWNNRVPRPTGGWI